MYMDPQLHLENLEGRRSEAADDRHRNWDEKVPQLPQKTLVGLHLPLGTAGCRTP